MDKIKTIFLILTKTLLCGLGILLLVCIINYIFFHDVTEDLGGGYKFDTDVTQAIFGPRLAIPPHIANVSYDDRFIIVKQQLHGTRPAAEFYSMGYEYNYPSVRGNFYWIIDKHEETFYGPLLLKDFNEKRDSLKITLAFNPENEREYISFHDGTVDLGGCYEYDPEVTQSISGARIDIPPHIVNVNYDDRFIIVKQQLRGPLPHPEFYLMDYEYPSVRGNFYWIIDKHEETFYGPLLLKDFNEKRDSLKIPLAFNPENERQ